MKESYREGLANHPDPESCMASREAAIEALTGAPADWVLSCEISVFGVPTPFSKAEGNIEWSYRKLPEDSAQSETPGMQGNSTRENRETPSTPVARTGRLEKALSQKSDMNVGGESDGRVLPSKCPNNGGQPLAEGMEERRPIKENITQTTAPRTQSQISELSGLLDVRKVARKERRTRFTALLHHVTVNLLWDSYYALKRDAAPGVDGLTWREYGTDLEDKLADLHSRIQSTV